MLQADTLGKLRQLFDEIDVNHDGRLTLGASGGLLPGLARSSEVTFRKAERQVGLIDLNSRLQQGGQSYGNSLASLRGG